MSLTVSCVVCENNAPIRQTDDVERELVDHFSQCKQTRISDE